MKLYEKILLFGFLFSFGLQLLPSFTGKSLLFILPNWLLAGSYLVGGYWLFNHTQNKTYLLPITAGFAFATSIFVIPFSVWLRQDKIYQILPSINSIFCLGVIIYLIVKRKTVNNTDNIKNISKRAVVILVATAFFAYTPASFTPYRKLLIALNNGNTHLLNNLYTFEYTEACESALNEQDCDKAITFAEKANKAGLDWLGVKESELQSADTALQYYLHRIDATFSNLYEAYRCKATKAYNEGNFQVSLEDHKKAHRNLLLNNPESEYWRIEESWALNNMADCYRGLKQYRMADSLYLSAIKHYKASTNTEGNDLAIFYSNFALSLAENFMFEYSNTYYRASNKILRNDTVKNRKELALNYLNIAENHIKQDSIPGALFLLKKALQLTKTGEPETCSAYLYYGACLYELGEYHKSDSVLKNCLECYKNQPKENGQNIAETYLMLTQVSIALAKYDDAKKYINTGINITTKNYSSNSSRHAGYLKVAAYLNKVVGNYKISEGQYNQALSIYKREFGSKDRRLPSVLSGLAELEIILSELSSAKQHSDTSLSIAASNTTLNFPGAANLLNSAAYVYYCSALHKRADTLYRKVILINDRYGLLSNAGTATALNGIGLIETEKKNFKKADSLFKQSLELHKKIFTDNHPATATIYLNLGILYIQDGRFSEAEMKIDKSLSINRKFFENSHDVFADILVAYGDLAQKRGRKKLANENYRKALEIYKNKFSDRHGKILLTERKLRL